MSATPTVAVPASGSSTPSRTEPLDTAGAVAFAARQAAIDETFVVVNGDVLTGLDVGALVAFHQARRASGSVALTPVDDPSAFGVVVTDPDGRVTAFIEKPRREDAPTNLINAGTYVLEPDVLERIPTGRRVSIERETFPDLVGSGGLYAMASDEPWVDVGTPAKYLEANLDLGAADHAFPAARVVASVLGEDVEVAEEAVVERSVVLDGARIGRGATVLGSIVGPHAVIGAGATLDGLSVVGAGVHVAAGQSVAGERVPESVPAMKTLVTGGAGFIGSTLVDRLLAEGHAVDVVDDLSSGSLANLAAARAEHDHQFRFHQLDVRSADIVELIGRRRPEVIYHLAAQADVRVSVARPAFDAEVNVIGSLQVLEGARSAGSRKVVFASSGGTIYGDPDPSELPVPESHPQHPVSPYGVAKKVVADYLYVYAQLHGLASTVLALANVYGPRQDPHGEAGVVAIFTGRLLDGQICTIFGDGSQTRDFVYVDDVVDAFARAAGRADGELLNIGTGVETSVNDLYGTLAAAAGADQQPKFAPARPGELARSCLDPTRAGTQLGWKPWTSMADGAAAVADWFRGQRS